MKQPSIPTPAQAVRLVFKRAALALSREYAFVAQSIEVPSAREAAEAIAKPQRERKAKKS